MFLTYAGLYEDREMKLVATGGDQGHYHGDDRLDGQDQCLMRLSMKESCGGVPGTYQYC